MKEPDNKPKVFRIKSQVIFRGEDKPTMINFPVLALDIAEAVEEAEKYLKSFDLGDIYKIEDLGEPVNINIYDK